MHGQDPVFIVGQSKLLTRPKNFEITVSDVRVSAGAGFIVVQTGNILTMPGLLKTLQQHILILGRWNYFRTFLMLFLIQSTNIFAIAGSN